MSSAAAATAVRLPAELLYARELAALAANDAHPRPPGWRLSPRAVRTFLAGSDGRELTHDWEGQSVQTAISRKFYGDDPLLDRCIVTLMGNNALILVGEPGTAKSMLSELLAAAISGLSTQTIQGAAGTTEDQIKYSWNYALLLSQGPTPQALVPSPLHAGMSGGSLVRFEELTRCAPEVQDVLISLLSEKMMVIPELGEQSVLLAARGFNVVATANVRDRGVHEMSSALKRRFNFQTVRPIADKALELELVTAQTRRQLAEAQATVECEPRVLELLVTTFHDLRSGRTEEGTVVDRPSTVMSTAEAVSVGVAAGLEACYYGQGRLESEHLVKHLVGTVLKDDVDDIRKLKHYFDVVVKARRGRSGEWKSYYDHRGLLDG